MKRLLFCLIIIIAILAVALAANASLGRPGFNAISEPAAMLLAGIAFIGLSGLGKAIKKPSRADQKLSRERDQTSAG